jgi:hypothetical protein
VEQFLLPDGTEIWLLERRLFHRIDGPAVIHPDGREEWWHLGDLQGVGTVADAVEEMFRRDEYVGFSEMPIRAALVGA